MKRVAKYIACLSAFLMLAGCSVLGEGPAEAESVNTIDAGQPSAASEHPQISAQPLDPARIDPKHFAPPLPTRMAFIWYDHPLLQTRDFMETRVQLTLAQGLTRMRFPLAQLGLDCTGAMLFEPADESGLVGGRFEISCSDSSVISGFIVPVQDQDAINGQGIDQHGRSIIFAIQMDG